MSSLLEAALGIPRLLVGQMLRPIRIAMQGPMPRPKTQRELADLVDNSLKHEIRAGYTHRFITLMFVTVGERVFCRRYTYGEPSWHSVFQTDPAGQVRLDKTVVNIEARVPQDLHEIVPDVDQAYADALKKLGASYMLAGATEPRAQESTMEVRLAEPPVSAPWSTCVTGISWLPPVRWSGRGAHDGLRSLLRRTPPRPHGQDDA